MDNYERPPRNARSDQFVSVSDGDPPVPARDFSTHGILDAVTFPNIGEPSTSGAVVFDASRSPQFRPPRRLPPIDPEVKKKSWKRLRKALRKQEREERREREASALAARVEKNQACPRAHNHGVDTGSTASSVLPEENTESGMDLPSRREETHVAMITPSSFWQKLHFQEESSSEADQPSNSEGAQGSLRSSCGHLAHTAPDEQKESEDNLPEVAKNEGEETTVVLFSMCRLLCGVDLYPRKWGPRRKHKSNNNKKKNTVKKRQKSGDQREGGSIPSGEA